MLVDYERVLVRLRQELAGRQGIGVGALFALIGQLEAECSIEEGLPEKALRLYGQEFFSAVVMERGEDARLDGNPYFAGLVDGEGCFYISASKSGYFPLFQIVLRWDDRAVLQAAQQVFGGRLHRAEARGSRNPAMQYTVADKASLVRLTTYFDRFPLLAKKARDYGMWREAVDEYVEHGARAERLPAIREALQEGREYRESPDDDLMSSGIQPSPVPAHAPAADGSGAAPSNGAQSATKESHAGDHRARGRTAAPAPA